jgi:hypothetical protein
LIFFYPNGPAGVPGTGLAVSGATVAGTGGGIVQGIAHLADGLARALLLIAAFGQDLLMAILLASSCFGSGIRISRTPSL